MAITVNYILVALSFYGIQFYYSFTGQFLSRLLTSFEQNMIILLGTLLVFYNNPFHLINVFWPNNFTILLAEFFDISFFTSLGMLWLISFERQVWISKETVMNAGRKRRTMTRPKICFFSAFFLFECLVYIFLTIKMRVDPTYSVRDNWSFV